MTDASHDDDLGTWQQFVQHTCGADVQGTVAIGPDCPRRRRESADAPSDGVVAALLEDARLKRKISNASACHHVQHGSWNKRRVAHHEGKELCKLFFVSRHQRVPSGLSKGAARFTRSRAPYARRSEQPKARDLV